MQPSPKDLDQILIQLALNGLGFIRRSTEEVKVEPGVAVSHFAVGAELLLKARLFHEHWVLVAERPHSATWTALKNGTLKTLSAGSLVSSITSVTGTDLRREGPAFAKLFAHRNQVLHFLPAPTVALAATEQFRGWYYLHRLLIGAWREVFDRAEMRVQIDVVDRAIRRHREFLEVRFDQLTAEGEFAAGRFPCCPVCSFESCVVPDEALPITVAVCRVCDAPVEVLNFGCGHPIVAPDECAVGGGISCDCGSTHTAQELARALDLDHWTANCLACHEASTVAQIGGGLKCFFCGCPFLDFECYSCPRCAVCWAGVEPEDTWFGCSDCGDGSVPWGSSSPPAT